MSFSAPAANLNNVFLGRPADRPAQGQWSTLRFPLPAAVQTALLGDFPRAQLHHRGQHPERGAAAPSRQPPLSSGTLTPRGTTGQPSLPPITTNPLFGFETLTDSTGPRVRSRCAARACRPGQRRAVDPEAAATPRYRSRLFATSRDCPASPPKLSPQRVGSLSQQPNFVLDGCRCRRTSSCPSAGLYDVSLGQAKPHQPVLRRVHRVTFAPCPPDVVERPTRRAARTPRLSFGLSVDVRRKLLLRQSSGCTN